MSALMLFLLGTGCTFVIAEVPCDTGSDDTGGSGSGDDSGGDDTGGSGSGDDTGTGPDLREDWVALSVGGLHTCGLDTAGEIACWGSDSEGQLQAPVGPFEALAAGYEHTCGLDADGEVSCWGRGDESPPTGPFESITAGGDHSCGVLQADGSLSCWGRDDSGQATPPEGTFTTVAAGWLHSCAVASDGSLSCWGRDEEGQATPPEGTDYVEVSAGRDHSCARTEEGSVDCWGEVTAGTLGVLSQSFEDVAAGMDFACGIEEGGEDLQCLGAEGFAADQPPEGGGPWADVDSHSGAQHACVLAVDLEGDGDGAAISCWGNGELGQLDVPEAP